MEKLNETIKRLQTLKGQVDALAGQGSSGKRRTQAGGIKGEIDAIRKSLTELPDTKGKKIDQFFAAVGEGARVAQEQLDQQSAVYMQNRPAFAPETMFRVPKVTANLKLALSSISQEGLDFFVYKKTLAEEELMEQEISFDIVSAQPPPEALAALADLPLGQIVASNDSDRKAAHAALKKVKTSGAQEQAQLNAAVEIMKPTKSFRHVLVFKNEKYFVLIYVPPVRAENTPEKGGAAILIPNDPEFGTDATAFAIPTDGNADKKIRFAFRILAPLADRQAEFLNELKRL